MLSHRLFDGRSRSDTNQAGLPDIKLGDVELQARSTHGHLNLMTHKAINGADDPFSALRNQSLRERRAKKLVLVCRTRSATLLLSLNAKGVADLLHTEDATHSRSIGGLIERAVFILEYQNTTIGRTGLL